MYRQILCMLGFTLAAGCAPRPDAAPVPVIQLLRELPRAEARPPSGFSVTTHADDGDVRPAIAAPVPGRLTIRLPLPRRAVLRSGVAIEAETPSAAVRFRVGVSDERIYEGIQEVVVTGQRPGWIDLRADLSAYAGFKWSLFYRPDRITWRLVLATDVMGPAPVRAFWGRPEIATDAGSAREYLVRRERLRSREAESQPE
jgi:hypothetical protein